MFALTICTYGILICNLCLLVDFKFSFAFHITFNLVKNVLFYLFSAVYYESLALNTIDCAHFCLYLWHETYKNCVQIIFLYLMLHIFYYNGILYLALIANAIIFVLQVY